MHLIKCIRNNWITEKCKTLTYWVYENGAKKSKTARWFCNEELFYLESKNNLPKMSKLNEVSVFPKPIERQKVSSVLNVFSDNTITALMTHPQIVERVDKSDFVETAGFLKIVLNWWRIMNVKEAGGTGETGQRKEIVDTDDPKLDTILSFVGNVLGHD